MPRSTASRSRALTVSAPAWWPARTGTPRAWAQRPLPSVMMATYRGSVMTVRERASVRAKRFEPARSRRSNLQDLRFLALEVRVQLGDALVGDLLQLGLGAALLVLADLALLAQLAQVVHDVAADVADLDPALLRDVVRDLDELLAALLGQRRDRQADEVAVVRRVEPQVGVADRLLDRLDRARIEGLHREQLRLGRVDRRQLLERRRRAVVLDVDAVEERRRRAAGAHGPELRLRRLHRLAHPTPRVGQQFVEELTHWSPGSPPARRTLSARCCARRPC